MNDQPETMNEFEAALQQGIEVENLRVGDVVQGTIVEIHGDIVLVDVGGKAEAVLQREELDQPGTGDPVEVVVTAVGEQIEVSHRMALEQKLKDQLADAVESGEAVQGKVSGRRKGGFDVILAGVRGFCPMSQISDQRGEDLDSHLGQVYDFKVLEYEPDNHKLVVSRAALLRAEKEKLRKQVWESLEEGALVTGAVHSLADFGAFIDLGGVDGLVHVTEISHQRVQKPSDVLSLGQEVEAKVIGLDRDKQRISLSIKATQEDPWSQFLEETKVGAAFQGQVVRKVPFGLFIQMAPGIDGLLHVSQFQPGVDLSAFEVGTEVDGWVKEINPDDRRISLTQRRLPDHDPWERIEMRYQEGQTVDGTVERGVDFGVFVELEPGVTALVPISETGLERGADPREAFKAGEKVMAKVISVDGNRQRISLSVRAQKKDSERNEYLKHMNSGQVDEGPSVTGFGAELMKALGKDSDVGDE